MIRPICFGLNSEVCEKKGYVFAAAIKARRRFWSIWIRQIADQTLGATDKSQIGGEENP